VAPGIVDVFGLDTEQSAGRRIKGEDADCKEGDCREEEVEDESGTEKGGFKAPASEGRKLAREGGAIGFEDDIVRRWCWVGKGDAEEDDTPIYSLEDNTRLLPLSIADKVAELMTNGLEFC